MSRKNRALIETIVLVVLAIVAVAICTSIGYHGWRGLTSTSS